MNGQDFPFGSFSAQRLPTLRDIATPMFRHPKLVLMTFLSIVVAAILAIVLLPKDYEAKMKILVTRERVDTAVSPGRDAVMSAPGDVTEEDLNSEVELLKSRDLLEKVVISCNLQELLFRHFWDWVEPEMASGENLDGRKREKNISRAVLALEEKLEIEPLKKNELNPGDFRLARRATIRPRPAHAREPLSGKNGAGSPSSGGV